MNWNSTFKNPNKPMARSQMKRGCVRIRSGRSTSKPTIEEQAWMDWVADFGCVVCWLFHKAKTPCAVHHIVEGGRRLGHLWTIGLCDPGHHQGGDQAIKISRHPNKKRFETAYGTEYELHAYLVDKRKILETR